MRATDGGYIPCTTDRTLTVAVTRNNFAPLFIPNNDYVTTILETHNVIQPVYTVTANDRDIQVFIECLQGFYFEYTVRIFLFLCRLHCSKTYEWCPV